MVVQFHLFRIKCLILEYLHQSRSQILYFLVHHHLHLLGVQRDEESVITFGDLTPKKGDHVLYVSKHRVDWKTLCDGT